MVVVAALVAARTSVNYYVLTPGDATPVAPYIDVPAADNHPLTGKILLTDVYVTQLNALNYLQYRFFDSDSQVLSSGDLLGPTTNENQYLDQGYLEMAQAQSFATAAALSHLGYAVSVVERGRAHLRDHGELAGGRLAARGAGDHCREHHAGHDRLLPDRRAARVNAWPARGAQGRGLLHQQRREFRQRADRDQVGDARDASQGTRRHRLWQATQADRLPRDRAADATGLALPH